MSRLVFWDSGHGGAAEVAAACAITLGLHYPLRALLFNDGRSGDGVEGGLRLDGRQNAASGEAEALFEHGVEALLRLSASRRLTSSNFADYTLPLLRGRLDLVSGTRTGSLGGTGAVEREIGELLAAAEQAYDLVVLQARGRGRLGEVLAARRNEDVIVAVLPQRRTQLEDFFAEAGQNRARLRQKLCLAVHPYDPQSGWSLANLKRRYGSTLPMIGIPYHSEFTDAWNDRELLAFFRRYRFLLKKGGSRESLLAGYRELASRLLELSGQAFGAGSGQREGGRNVG